MEKRGGVPFRALIAKRSGVSCAQHAARMVDIPGYTRVFPGVTKAKVVKQGARYIDYELTIDAPFNPVVPGRVEPVSKDTIVFHDQETGGRGTFRLHDDGAGCLLAYHMALPGTKRSGWTQLVQRIEPGGADVGEMVGALAVMRGYAPHGKRPRTDPRALDRLAHRGIAMSLLRHHAGGLHLQASRVVDLPFDEVQKRLRDRDLWVKRGDAVREAKTRDATTRWSLGYLGGGVNFKTRSSERAAPDRLVQTEKILGGDVKRGYWQITAEKVSPRETRVRMLIDADFTRGSFVLSKLAESNDAARDTLAIELALNVLADLLDDEAR